MAHLQGFLHHTIKSCQPAILLYSNPEPRVSIRLALETVVSEGSYYDQKDKILLEQPPPAFLLISPETFP